MSIWSAYATCTKNSYSCVGMTSNPNSNDKTNNMRFLESASHTYANTVLIYRSLFQHITYDIRITYKYNPIQTSLSTHTHTPIHTYTTKKPISLTGIESETTIKCELFADKELEAYNWNRHFRKSLRCIWQWDNLSGQRWMKSNAISPAYSIFIHRMHSSQCDTSKCRHPNKSKPSSSIWHTFGWLSSFRCHSTLVIPLAMLTWVSSHRNSNKMDEPLIGTYVQCDALHQSSSSNNKMQLNHMLEKNAKRVSQLH